MVDENPQWRFIGLDIQIKPTAVINSDAMRVKALMDRSMDRWIFVYDTIELNQNYNFEKIHYNFY